VTLIGWLILVIPLAIVGYAALRLVPIYLNYFRVETSVAQTVEQFKGGDEPSGAQTFRNALDRRFEIEGIDHPTSREIDVHRDSSHWEVVVDYEDQAPLFGNISVLVAFHKETTMQ
jgi:hypothetical protein